MIDYSVRCYGPPPSSVKSERLVKDPTGPCSMEKLEFVENTRLFLGEKGVQDLAVQSNSYLIRRPFLIGTSRSSSVPMAQEMILMKLLFWGEQEWPCT
jgi:hypothetical protein